MKTAKAKKTISIHSKKFAQLFYFEEDASGQVIAYTLSGAQRAIVTPQQARWLIYSRIEQDEQEIAIEQARLDKLNDDAAKAKAKINQLTEHRKSLVGFVKSDE
jgi:hypothetical protein